MQFEILFIVQDMSWESQKTCSCLGKQDILKYLKALGTKATESHPFNLEESF